MDPGQSDLGYSVHVVCLLWQSSCGVFAVTVFMWSVCYGIVRVECLLWHCSCGVLPVTVFMWCVGRDSVHVVCSL